MRLLSFKTRLAGGLLLASMLAVTSPAQPKVNVDEVLLVSFLKLNVVKQITAQGESLASDADAGAASEVKAFAEEWGKQRITQIRSDLEGWFNVTAKDRFRSFVAGYTSAEKQGDQTYLNMLSDSLALNDPQPETYAALRKAVVDRYLVPDVKEGSRILSRIQTWVEKKDAVGDVSLAQFVGAPAAPAASTVRAPARRAPPRPRVVEERDPLMDAEADFEEVAYEPDAEDLSPLDAYSSMRKKKREKVLKEAQEGMKLVADERKAAEEDYAAKKMAAAEAESAAVKEHTKDLADADKSAQKQRENSWGNRLKRIVGTTVSAAGGAMLGGVGTRAGEEAADALFD